MSENRWVALVRGVDGPGTLTAVTGVLSSRGVSFDSLSTGSVDAGAGVISVTFTTTERRQIQLMRTVGRLAAVHEVRVRRADDPEVKAAIVTVLPAGVQPPSVAGVRWSPGLVPGSSGPVLGEGTLSAVLDAVGAARAAGASTTATVVLEV